MSIIWLNGALLAQEAARIDPADRGLLLGDGLFETMAAQDGAIPDLPLHFARLCAGAALLRLPVPFDLAELAAACGMTLAANALQEAALRLTLTRGAGPRGVLPPASPRPTVLITAAALPPGGPLRLITASLRRDASSPLSRVKSLNYLPSVLARIEAADAGADDALMLNGEGFVVETSSANLFVKLAGLWVTPPAADGALPGIRRAKLLAAGRVQEMRLAPAQLLQADAILAGNALTLRPVVALDGHKIAQARLDELHAMG